jgi:hypothetical protein
MTLEAPIVTRIIEALSARGLIVLRNVVEPSRYNDRPTGLGAGSSDLLVIDPVQNGRAVFLEVKRSELKSVTHVKRRAQQAAFRIRMLSGGAVAAQVSSVDDAWRVVVESRARRKRNVDRV